MKNDCYKYLPGKKPSLLSLNDYVPGDIDAGGKVWRYADKRGKDIYSTEVLTKKTEESFKEYDRRSFPDVMSYLRQKISGSPEESGKVKEILDQTAEGLTAVFYSLSAGTEESRRVNHLTEHDWEFWKRCSRVFLVGKLAQGKLGQYLEESMKRHLKRLDMNKLSVQCFDDPKVKTISLLGCAQSGFGQEIVYVFDFGNTAVKCGRAVLGSDGYDIEEDPAIIHQDYRQMNNTIETAKQIHDEIVFAVLQTIQRRQEDCSVYEVHLCMANNMMDHEIADRGSYRSLRLLAPCYGEYLQQSLEQETGKKFAVHIMNECTGSRQSVSGMVAGGGSCDAGNPYGNRVPIGTYIFPLKYSLIFCIINKAKNAK